MPGRDGWQAFVVSVVCGMLVVSAGILGPPGRTSPGASFVRGAVAATARSAGSFVGTLSLINNTLLPGNVAFANVQYPLAMAIDDARRTGYVVGDTYGPGTLARINLTTLAFEGAIPFRAPMYADRSQAGIAYDPANDHAYVTDTYGGSVTVFDVGARQIVKEIPLGIGTWPLGVAYDPANGHVYVANSWKDRVTVIDTATDTIAKNITVGSSPNQIAFDSVNHYLYVTNYDSSTISVIDGATDAVVTTIGGLGSMGNPRAIAFDAANGKLYVTQPQAGSVSVIDGATNQVVGTVALGRVWSMLGIAYNPANKDVYVTAAYGTAGLAWLGKVFVIDGATDTVVGEVPVGDDPAMPAVDPTTGDVFVPNTSGENVTVIQGATNTVVANISVGTIPTWGAYDSVNRRVYLSNNGGKSLFTIDAVTHRVLRETFLGIGSLPYGVAYDPANGDVYVVDPAGYSVIVVNGSTGLEVTRIPVGHDGWPEKIAYNPVNGHLYVTDNRGNAVIVIDGATNRILGNVSVGSQPLGLAVDDANGRVYVLNTFSGNVSVIDGETSRVVATVDLATHSLSGGIAYDSAHGRVYVPVGGNVTVIDAATNQVVGAVPLGPGASALEIAYNAANGYLYVTSLWGNVTVIDTSDNAVLGTLSVGHQQLPYDAIPASTYVYVTDSGSGAVSVIAMGGPAIASFTASPSTITLGSNVTLTVAATSEEGALSYAYVGLPRGCSSANATTLTCTPTETGAFWVTVAVTDTAARSVTASTALSVNPVPATNLGLPLSTAYAIFGAVAVVAVVCVVLAIRWMRRKRGTPPGAAPPPAPP